MPTEIYLSKANTKETQIIKEEEKLPDDEVLEEIEPEKKEAAEGKNAEAAEGTEEPKKLKIRKRPELINETDGVRLKARYHRAWSPLLQELPALHPHWHQKKFPARRKHPVLLIPLQKIPKYQG